MNKREFKKLLFEVTRCNIQRGWCCGTCFFAIKKNYFDNQDWQSLLLYRGDYPKEDLENLPDNPKDSIKKIWDVLVKIKTKRGLK